MQKYKAKLLRNNPPLKKSNNSKKQKFAIEAYVKYKTRDW